MSKKFMRSFGLIFMAAIMMFVPVSASAAAKKSSPGAAVSQSVSRNPVQDQPTASLDIYGESYVAKCLTSVQKDSIKKSALRSQFKAAATAGKAVGLTTAGTFLEHSLKDKPSDLTYSASSKYATQIMNSTEGKKIVSDFAAYVKGKDISTYTMRGSAALTSDKDLYLAYNLVSYVATGTKTANTWTLNITFYDVYDFAEREWSSTLSAQSLVTFINNYAYYAQTTGAIVPYKITVTGTAQITQ